MVIDINDGFVKFVIAYVFCLYNNKNIKEAQIEIFGSEGLIFLKQCEDNGNIFENSLQAIKSASRTSMTTLTIADFGEQILQDNKKIILGFDFLWALRAKVRGYIAKNSKLQ